jgi:hypothetical protein
MQALMKKEYADIFTSEDGSLHALVGLLTGQDSAKQPLALYCLANLAAIASRPLQIARAAGPYLITQLTGSEISGRGAELACTVLANLAMAEDARQAVKVLVNQDVIPSLIRVVSSGSGGSQEEDGLQEVAYQALYHIIIQTDLEAETLCGLSQLCLGRFSFSFFRFFCRLIRLGSVLLAYLFAVEKADTSI